MRVTFHADVWYWRGPSPFHFVTVPAAESAELQDVAASVTYGWGMIPVMAQVGDTTFKTSLFPKDGGYIVPLKDAVRRAEDIDVGDGIDIVLTLAG